MKEQTFEHNPGDHEDPMGGPTWLVGIIGVIILIVVLFGVQSVLKATQTSAHDEFVVIPNVTELNAVHERDAKKFVAAPQVVEYVDEFGEITTRLAIPIEDAMKLTAGELKSTGGD